jgi:hypothetical protein
MLMRTTKSGFIGCKETSECCGRKKVMLQRRLNEPSAMESNSSPSTGILKPNTMIASGGREDQMEEEEKEVDPVTVLQM